MEPTQTPTPTIISVITNDPQLLLVFIGTLVVALIIGIIIGLLSANKKKDL